MAEFVEASPTTTRPVGAFSQLHRFLGGFPTAFFALAALTDFAYINSANLMWSHFSAWLILAALVTGVLAVLAGGADWLTGGARGRRGVGWHLGLTLLALVVGAVNLLVHFRDGWTAVMPEGMILSVVTVVLLFAGGIAAAIADRRGEVRA